jgi:hypothetical protein
MVTPPALLALTHEPAIGEEEGLDLWLEQDASAVTPQSPIDCYCNCVGSAWRSDFGVGAEE